MFEYCVPKTEERRYYLFTLAAQCSAAHEAWQCNPYIGTDVGPMEAAMILHVLCNHVLEKSLKFA